MQFNSVNFLFFFPIVVLVFFIIPKRSRMYWLLFASYFFYMSWNAKYVLLIGASTVITYISALLFSYFDERECKYQYKKVVIILCIGINIGILALFNEDSGSLRATCPDFESHRSGKTEPSFR